MVVCPEPAALIGPVGDLDRWPAPIVSDGKSDTDYDLITGFRSWRSSSWSLLC
jgi:hypothetical protein